MNWFIASSLFKSVLKESDRDSSLNRQRKILIRFKCEYAWIPYDRTHTNEIADEFVWLWYIKSTHKPIHAWILEQGCRRSEKAIYFIIYTKMLKLILLIAFIILAIRSIVKIDVLLFRILLILSMLAIVWLLVRL